MSACLLVMACPACSATGDERLTGTAAIIGPMRSFLGRAALGLAAVASAVMALGYAVILGGIATPPEHSPRAAASCLVARAAEPSAGDAIEVYFSCDPAGANPVKHGALRPSDAVTPEGRLRDALNGLLGGPSPAERKAGWTSFFSERTRGMLVGISIEADGRTVMDFGDFSALVANASTGAGASRLLAELNATAFQFPEVTSVEYRFDGSCAAFWAWLGGTCHAERRPG